MVVIGVVPFFTEVLRPEESACRVPDQRHDLEFLSDVSQPSPAEFSALERRCLLQPVMTSRSARRLLLTGTGSQGRDAMSRTIQNLQRVMCGLRGHEAVLHFERHRLSLRCLKCGHETTGWILQSETHHAARLIDSLSHAHIRGFRRWPALFEGIIGVSLARRLSRSRHATT